jgi:cytochrome c biogenesis protein CcdA/HEAT repeat protein
LLGDPDPFVRSGAIKAVIALGLKDAAPKLKAMMLADVTMAPSVIEGYKGLDQKLDREMLDKLNAAPPEVRLATLGAATSPELLLSYATDPNTDLVCAALRRIAADDDTVGDPQFSGLLLAALRSNEPAKVAAVIEPLRLPSGSSGRLDPALLQALATYNVKLDGPTTLDPLYDAFLLPGRDELAGGGGAAAERSAPTPRGSVAELIKELARFTTPETPENLRYAAILNLARVGNAAGGAALLRELPNLTTARKIAACEALNNPSSKDAIAFLTPLLRDPVSEVRSAAAECALSNERAKALISLVFTELAKPDSPLQPHEVYGYRFEYAVRQNGAVVNPWALATLQDPAAPAARRILALVAVRKTSHQRLIDAVRDHAAAKDPNVRRAAWQALLTMRPSELGPNARAIADDPAAFVRAVLPDRAAVSGGRWRHLFSDSAAVEDGLSEYNRRAPKLDDEVKKLLDRLARRDPSPLVRFEASFALISLGVPVDFEAFAGLLARQPKDNYAGYRISNWLENNASRATPALRPLLALADTSRISPEKLKLLNARIAPEQATGFATFASLAAEAAKPADPKAPILAPEAPAASPAARKSLEVILFYKPGCPECAQVRELLAEQKRDFPLLEVIERNIIEPSGTILNQALCDRLNAPSNRHTVAPAVFTQGGFLIKEIAPRDLGELLAKTMALPQDDAWRRVDETATVAAREHIDRRYEAFTLPVVLLAGLFDGLNPCAFATIIFFLSYLQIARRTPREMLMVGIAFIAAVFLAYFAAGMLLYQVLDQLHARFAGLQRWLNWTFAALALLAAFLSLRDALRARAGRMDEMTLQLPAMLKNRIRGVIRSGARARNFVIAAFVSGIVISFLELACTGQVYAPIIYQIQQGNLNAINWLLLYNLAFIIPLVVIFLLAYAGLRSDALIAFQKKHTCAVKLALALVFLALAVFILFGHRLLRQREAPPVTTAQVTQGAGPRTVTFQLLR